MTISERTTFDLPRDPWERLDLTLVEAVALGGNLWSRVLRFLLRWEYDAQALAYVEALLAAGRRQRSVYDAQAEAQLALGRPDDALSTLAQRHEMGRSLASSRLEARALLAAHEPDDALTLAQQLADDNPESIVAWTTLVEVRLARGELDEALAACTSLGALRSNGRSYLLLRTEIHLALGDHVVAGAYAAQVESSTDAESALPAYVLRRLAAYYASSDQPTREQEVREHLRDLFLAELEELRAALGAAPATAEGASGATQTPQGRENASEASWPQAPSLHAEPIPVGPEERRRIERGARQLFGFAALLPGQAETMAAALRGEDVLTVLPTGGGKSLCYQLPALLDGGTTLVLSPLIALMKDQVDSLPEAVRPLATSLNYSLTASEMERRLAAVAHGAYRLVYAAPERLRQAPFLHALQQAPVSRLVIDEAHCISMWGHDFRPDYLYIHRAREVLGSPPVLAMTATAPPIVRQDIVARLSRTGDGVDMRIVAGQVTRPNLFFEVARCRNQDEKLSRLVEVCLNEAGSGIVYVDTRNRAERLAELLSSQGESAGYYHAGIGDRDARAAAQDRFMSGRVRIMVATVAFGMGIDKSDIRFIVHFCPPPSIESYYQEAGRAGRDGLPARCVLLYSPSDRGTLTRRSHRDALDIEFLRAVYGAISRRLSGQALGQVAIDDLRRDCRAEDTAVRVAVGMLEEARLVRRYGDLPRVASLRLAADVDQLGGVEDSADLIALANAAGLTPYEYLDVDLARAAQRAGLDPRRLEGQLLRWSARGLLSYRGAQRDMLIELLPPGENAPQRVNTLLEQYELIQARRIDEIARYATTHRCRHGHLAGYLNGEGVDGCASCDNCQPEARARRRSAGRLPAEAEQLATVLRCLEASRWGWGRVSLARILRADARMQERASGLPQWGALRFRSETALLAMIDRLVEARLVEVEALDNGGEVLQISDAGRAAANDAAWLQGLAEAPHPEPRGAGVRRSDAASNDDDLAYDEEIFQRLRAWRSAQAAKEDLPPYCVAHDSVLRRLAKLMPASEEALLSIKGVGSATVAKYGEHLLRLLQGVNAADG